MHAALSFAVDVCRYRRILLSAGRGVRRVGAGLRLHRRGRSPDRVHDSTDAARCRKRSRLQLERRCRRHRCVRRFDLGDFQDAIASAIAAPEIPSAHCQADRRSADDQLRLAAAMRRACCSPPR